MQLVAADFGATVQTVAAVTAILASDSSISSDSSIEAESARARYILQPFMLNYFMLNYHVMTNLTQTTKGSTSCLMGLSRQVQTER